MSFFSSIIDCANFSEIDEELNDSFSVEKLIGLITPTPHLKPLSDTSLNELSDLTYQIFNVLNPDDESGCKAMDQEGCIKTIKMVYALHVRWFCEKYEYNPMVDKRRIAKIIDESLRELSKYAKIKYKINLPEAILLERLSMLYPAALIILPHDSNQLGKIMKALKNENDLEIKKWPYEFANIYRANPYRTEMKKEDKWKKAESLVQCSNGTLIELYDISDEQTYHQLFGHQDFILNMQKSCLGAAYSSFDTFKELFFSNLTLTSHPTHSDTNSLAIKDNATQTIINYGFAFTKIWTKFYEKLFQNENKTTQHIGNKEQFYNNFECIREQISDAVSMRNRYIFK
jgi:hypothetical protein